MLPFLLTARKGPTWLSSSAAESEQHRPRRFRDVNAPVCDGSETGTAADDETGRIAVILDRQ